MSDRLARLTHLTAHQRAQLEMRLQQRSGRSRDRAPAAAAELRRGAQWAPMTFAQRSFWFLDQRYPGSAAYHIPLVLQLDGALRQNELITSLNMLIERHEALRATFVQRGDDFVQEFLPPFAFPLTIKDFSFLALPQAREATEQWIAEETTRCFDLAHGPLLRGSLCTLHETLHILHLTIHHIIFDAWSMKVFYQELSHIYTDLCTGNQTVHPPAMQFGDYAAWQQAWVESEQAQQQLLYWTHHLQGAPLFQRFPTDQPRSTAATLTGKHLRFLIPQDLMQAVRQLSQNENVTVYTTLLAAWSLLLAFSLRKDEVVVGSPTANRNAQTASMIGFCVNTLLLRCDLSGNPSFHDVLQHVKQTVRNALAHQEFPYEGVIHHLQAAAPEEASPLQIKFIYQNIPDIFTLPLPDLHVTFLDASTGTAKFDLLLDIVETPGETAGEIEYRSDLFYDATIATVAQHYQKILRLAVEDPQREYRALKMTILASKGDHAMEPASQERRKKGAFKKIQPKVMQIQEEHLVSFTPLTARETLPLVGEPSEQHVGLAQWVEHNTALLASHLQASGGILFRNFAVASVDAFQNVVQALSGELLDYTERSTPRSTVEGRVFTSTEYPADQSIQMHSEMSYSSHWPRKIWFYCVQPAQEGGITPLADNRKVYHLIDPAIRALFEEKQVMYVRNYGEHLDLPWQDVFQTESVTAVEDYCRQAGISFSWQGQQRLRTWQVCQAVARHPETGEMLWFNQAHLFHCSSLDPQVRASLLQVTGYDDLPRNACFGDGTPIDDAILEHIRDAYRQVTVRFPWQQGDLVLLDNMLIAHGRDPFSGKRRIVVAMAENSSAFK